MNKIELSHLEPKKQVQALEKMIANKPGGLAHAMKRPTLSQLKRVRRQEVVSPQYVGGTVLNTLRGTQAAQQYQGYLRARLKGMQKHLTSKELEEIELEKVDAPIVVHKDVDEFDVAKMYEIDVD